MAGNFFRGTSVEQDGRWGKSDEKLMAKMAKNGMFAPILETKVNLKKINLDVINRWVTQKIIEVVGFEDDILINLVINMLQGNEVDGKKMQLDVTGFLEKRSGAFVAELWTLMVDAQEQPSGIPSVFLQKKKEEILQRQSAPNRFGPTGTVPDGASQVRSDGAVATDSNTSRHSTRESASRDVKVVDKSRKRDRSRSPERRVHRDGDRRDKHRDRSHDRRSRSPHKREREDRDHGDRSHREDRDRRDSRSERDDRRRDGHSDRRRDSRDRNERHERSDRRRDRVDRHHDRSDRHRSEHYDRDRSPDHRKESHRESRRSADRSDRRKSRSPERRHTHRDDSRDRRHRHRSPHRDRYSRSRSPDRRKSKRSDSTDREDGHIEAKEVQRRNDSSDSDEDSKGDRDFEKSGKWTKTEDVDDIPVVEEDKEGIIIDE